MLERMRIKKHLKALKKHLYLANLQTEVIVFVFPIKRFVLYLSQTQSVFIKNLVKHYDKKRNHRRSKKKTDRGL